MTPNQAARRRLQMITVLLAVDFISANALSQTIQERIALATKEKEVVWYSNLAIDRGNALAQGFMRAYPGINVKYVRSNAPQLANRILAEHRAGTLEMDVLLISFFFVDSMTKAGVLANFVRLKEQPFHRSSKTEIVFGLSSTPTLM